MKARNMRRSAGVNLVLSTALVLVCARESWSAIISSSGAVQVIAPPADVVTGHFEDDSIVYTFAEKQFTQLMQSVPLDISVPGIVQGTVPNLSPSSVPAGAVVNSYYLHFDIVGSPSQGQFPADGSVTFDSEILGLIVLTDHLIQTNTSLGALGTVYETGDLAGFEFTNGEEWINLHADRRTVEFHLSVNVAADNFRILTAVPEPSSISAMVVAAAWCIRRRYRTRAS
jgi:hypothetical protein